MSYYDIQVSANLHRPIKSNQGRRQGKSLEGAKVPRARPRSPGGQRPLVTPSMKSCIDHN